MCHLFKLLTQRYYVKWKLYFDFSEGPFKMALRKVPNVCKYYCSKLCYFIILTLATTKSLKFSFLTFSSCRNYFSILKPHDVWIVVLFVLFTFGFCLYTLKLNEFRLLKFFSNLILQPGGLFYYNFTLCVAIMPRYQPQASEWSFSVKAVHYISKSSWSSSWHWVV